MGPSTGLTFRSVNNFYGARHPLPAADEAASFQSLHHLIHRGSRHKEVPLNVGFRRGASKAEQVLLDELKIFLLAQRRLNSARALVAEIRRETDAQATGKSLDKQGGAVRKVNREIVIIAFQARNTLSANLPRYFSDIQYPALAAGRLPGNYRLL
jgi:hypothetical protein